MQQGLGKQERRGKEALGVGKAVPAGILHYNFE